MGCITYTSHFPSGTYIKYSEQYAGRNSRVMGRKAKDYFERNFERELLLDKLIAILKAED